MNEYKFHIGDYRKDTGHLTFEEHGMYRWLIDTLYVQETPLSPDIRLLMRKMGLTSDQKDTLEQLLSEFFILTDEGYTHDRVSRELSRIYGVSASASANAQKRWDKVRAQSGGNAGAMRAHSAGSAGGMLPSNPVTQKPSNPKKKARANGRFKKPTPEEIQAYLDEIGEYRFTGQEFFDSNESKGWVVGKNRTPMVKWKSAVGTWRTQRNKSGEENIKKLKRWETGL